jgi:hypothetical protein
MNEAGDDDTPPKNGAPLAFKTILFLPGAMPDMVVDGTPRSEGWVGQCKAGEADDLCRRQLAVGFPDDWPALPPPAADGEPLPNYIERAVCEHPTVIALMQLGASVGLKPAIISPVRPGERTIQWWLLEYSPERRYRLIAHYSRQTLLFNYRKYLFWRLMVQLFDQLRSGEWIVFGLLATDADYALQPVPQERWHHPDMVLNYHPRGDWFRPDQRIGWPIPAMGLTAYGGLILQGVRTPVARVLPAPDQRPTPKDHSVRQWMRDRVTGWPDDKLAPSEMEDFQAATRYFAPGLTRDEFRIVRTTETPTEWRQRGPRKRWGEVKQSAANPRNGGTQI